MNRKLLLPLACLGLIAGCGTSSKPDSTLTLKNSALTSYDAMGTAKYRLTVKNGLDPSQVVFTTEYTSTPGNDGAFVYVGACDATAGANPHTLEVVLLEVRDDAGDIIPITEYINPTIVNGVETPLLVGNITCVENDDVLVPFSMTILFDADQGNVDLQGFVDDIYCSGKIDCRDEYFLHNGEALPSVIMALNCSAGDNDDSYFYFSDVTLTCTDGTTTVSSTIDLGGTPGASGPVAGWQQTFQPEFVGSTFDKCFESLVIGLDADAIAGMTCTLTADATVSDHPLPVDVNGNAILPPTGAYPYIHYEVVVSSPNGMCSNNGLDEVDSGVTTQHILNGVGGPLNALSEMKQCQQPVEPPQAIACGGLPFNAQVGPDGKDGYVVTATNPLDATTPLTAQFPLPDGYTLGDTCCTPACCLGTPSAEFIFCVGGIGNIGSVVPSTNGGCPNGYNHRSCSAGRTPSWDGSTYNCVANGL